MLDIASHDGKFFIYIVFGLDRWHVFLLIGWCSTDLDNYEMDR